MTQDTVQTPLEQLAQLVEEYKGGDLVEIPVPQKLMEQVSEEIRETIEHLQAVQRQLVQYEKMATLGQLMAGIAHEISTPIASINSNVNLFSRSLDKVKTILSVRGARGDGEESLHSATRDGQMIGVVSVLDKLNQSNQTACDRVVQIVQSLRSFARVGMTELREIDIHEELENALALVHHELKRRIEVIREYGDIPKCTCFPSRLSSVFVNMLMNASQAIEGKGQISIETFSELPALGGPRSAGSTIKVKFTDTGRGIPPENLEKLFEPGFTTKSPDEGTGLGLAICKQIMEEHHGKIEVESEVGRGTTFTVTLPIKYETSAQALEKLEQRGVGDFPH
jgi:signal transduction histidine kinase